MIKYCVLFTILGYLSGNIMFAYIFTRHFSSMDITQVSDDYNPGTANAFKYGGITIGILSLIFELGKGFGPVFLSQYFISTESFMFVFVLVAPVIGHAFPILFKNGGKAIAVSFGCLLGLYPNLNPALLLAMFYIFFSLIVTISPNIYRSIITFLLFAASSVFLLKPLPLIIGCVFISSVVIYKHIKMQIENLPEARISLFGKKS